MIEKRRGRPAKTDTPPPAQVLLWKTVVILPPHGEMVYVKGKKTTKDEYLKRLGKQYINNKGEEIDASQYTHWRNVY
ncbi:MAG: hypothetical protein AABY22_11035 [Nanoarchaeota archaeon]